MTASMTVPNRGQTLSSIISSVKAALGSSATLDVGVGSNEVPINAYLGALAYADNIVITKDDIGLGSVDNTSDVDKPISTDVQAALDLKVALREGYALSKNDFSDALKVKLEGITPTDYVQIWTLGALAYRDSISYDEIEGTPNIPVQVNADWNSVATDSLSYIKNKPNLAAVATSGAYADLQGKPNLAAYAEEWKLGAFAYRDAIDYAEISNTPAPQVNADWNSIATDSPARILNKPSLATIATSGLYDDLQGTPDLSVYARRWEMGALAYRDNIDYSEISNTPTIPAAPVQSNWNTTASSDLSYIVNKPTLGTAASLNTGTAGGNVPVLDSSGKLNTSVLPSLSITDIYAVTALTDIATGSIQKGDVAIVTSVRKSYIWDGTAWQELLTPTDAVTSVAGKTGVVTLEKADVGLSLVDNTSDLGKPISTATANALGVKQDIWALGGLAYRDSIDYSELSNTPAAQVQSDWSATSTSDLAYIKNKPSKLSQFTNDSNFLTQVTLTTDILPSIPPSKLQVLTTDKLPSIPSSKLEILTTDKLPSIPSSKLQALTTDLLPTIPVSKLATLTTDVIPSLPTSKITGLGTAATKNIPASGDAGITEVVLGSDSRLVKPVDVSWAFGALAYRNEIDYTELTNPPTLGTAASKNTGTSASQIPVLDSSGKLSSTIIPIQSTLPVEDSRAVATNPQTINAGVKFDFKQNTTESLSDGGTYFGEMTFRQYGSSTDWSGGYAHQLGFTDNGNIWQRSGTSTSWGAWKKLLNSSNYNSYSPTLTGTGASGTWAIGISGTATTATTANGLNTSNNYQVASISTGGSRIGEAGLTVNGTPGNNDSQIVLHKPSGVTWSQLVWDNAVYQGYNIYYHNGNWVHSNSLDPYNSLLATDNAGVLWHASNDSSASWNVASGQRLWDNTGTWTGKISSGAITSGLGYTPLNAATFTASNKDSPISSSTASNAIGYTNNVALFSQNDGALYVQAYSSTWAHQIFGDYRSGQIAVRGLNNGTWGDYRIILDKSNYTDYPHSKILSVGRVTKEEDGESEPSNSLTLRQVYANGYPTTYGNLITLGGQGGGQFLVGWSGTTGAHADNYIRSRRDTGHVWSPWAKLLTSANYNSYSPTLDGTGASGTWGINISGNAATATNATQFSGLTQSQFWNNSGQAHSAYTSFGQPTGFGKWFVHQGSAVTDGPPGQQYQFYCESVGLGDDYAYSQYAMQTAIPRNQIATNTYYWLRFKEGGTWTAWIKASAGYADSAARANVAESISSRDGDRNAGSILPTTSPLAIRFDFVSASTTGTGGNYSGVMTCAPWTGTTSSTGDASYQLAFGSTAVNGGGVPQLRLRKGIDTTWNAWIDIVTSENIGTYASLKTHTHTAFSADLTINSLTCGRGNGNSTSNVAFGYNCLTANSGTHNIAIGNEALKYNTTGSRNTAVGSQTLSSLTTGDNNTGIGYMALNSTTGTENTCVGTYAGYRITSGNYNTVIGSSAFYTNTTGYGNTILGAAAGSTLTSNYNVILGYKAAEFLGASDNNTIVGYNTAQGLYGGTQNTVIGSRINTGDVSSHVFIGDGGGNIRAKHDGTGWAMNGSVAASSFIKSGGTSSQVLMADGSTSDVETNHTHRTGNNNIRFGLNALLSLESGSSHNIGIGYTALNYTTTGDNNIAIGRSAMVSNRTGRANIAIGESASPRGAAASYCTAIGSYALYNNNYCNSSVSIGSNSLYTSKVPAINIAKVEPLSSYRIRVYTGTLNADGVSVTEIAHGFTAGSFVFLFTPYYQYNVGANIVNATTTTFDIDIYNPALSGTVYASNLLTTMEVVDGWVFSAAGKNLAIGSDSGYSITTGGSNTLIGSSSGIDLTTGRANLFIGTYAGSGVKTGSNNTWIGKSVDPYYLSPILDLVGNTRITSYADLASLSNAFVMAADKPILVFLPAKTTSPVTTLDSLYCLSDFQMSNGDLRGGYGQSLSKNFIAIAGGPGAPTGTPHGNRAFPLYFDHTNNRLYIYNAHSSGTKWKSVQLS